MPQENVVLYNPIDEMDDDLNINLLKIWKAIWSRKVMLIKVFCYVLLFFILLTFILPKKYKVTADLYINKSNSSNMMEVNPYVLDDASGSLVTMGADKAINNEIELIKSELVLDKVIAENDLRYKRGKKKGELLSAQDFYKKGKKLKLDTVKNTDVITIEYKHKKPEVAYGVVSSLITNYIALHKEINTEKSKTDKKLLETEYEKTKALLNKKLNKATGLPAQSLSGIGNISAISAFSKSASQAIGNIKGQYIAGERSQIEVSEESQKLTQLAAKLEWAKMVEQMSDSSKVLVLNEPKLYRPFENSSPKLLINIILGCVFGYLSALSTLIYVELVNEKLTYTMVGNNVVYDCIKNIDSVETELISYAPQTVLLISLIQLPQDAISSLKSTDNTEFIYADLSIDFVNKVKDADKIMIISKIGTTSSDAYKKTKNIIEKQKKEVVCDLLV